MRTVEITIKGDIITKTIENFHAKINERMIQPSPRTVIIMKSANLKFIPDLIISIFLLKIKIEFLILIVYV